MSKHLFGLRDLSYDDILSLNQRAQFFFTQKSNLKPTKILDGEYIAPLFFEDSTRTQVSFEVAARNLGAKMLHFNPRTSSANKGESLSETLKTLEMMEVKWAIIRERRTRFYEQLYPDLQLQVINAGDGHLEHPSQGLLDLFTITQNFPDFPQKRSLKIAFIGDIKHSRVVHSNVFALRHFPVEFMFCGPDEFLNDNFFKEQNTAIQRTQITQCFAEADVLMFLRVQKERHEQHFELDNYLRDYGLTAQKMKEMQKDAIVMHPGPFNLNTEIQDGLQFHPQVKIHDQVRNGVYTRMAIFDWLKEKRV